MSRFTLNGFLGFKGVEPEGTVFHGPKVTDPAASVGIMGLVRGTKAYLILVVTADRATAEAFLTSFKVLTP